MIISLNNYNLDVLPTENGGIWVRGKDVMRVLGFKNKNASFSQYINKYGFKAEKPAGTKKVGRILYIRDYLLYNVLSAWAKCPTTSRPWATAAATFAMSLADAHNTGLKKKDWHLNEGKELLVLNPDVNELPTYTHAPKKAKIIGFDEKIVLGRLEKAEKTIKGLTQEVKARDNTILGLQEELRYKKQPVSDEKSRRIFTLIRDLAGNGAVPDLEFRHTAWALITHFNEKGEIKILPLAVNGQ